MPERRRENNPANPAVYDDEHRYYEEPQYYGLGGGPSASSTEPEEWQTTVADWPIIGWLTGASDAVARHEDAVEADRNRGIWQDLAYGAPTYSQLVPDVYSEGAADEFGSLFGRPSELTDLEASADQQASMQALRGLYESGGYTSADHAMSRAMRDQQAMQLGANNRAALQQMQARGMGGSGAELAMRMGAADSMAGANSMADAQLQQAAMQRALAALQGHASMSNTMQDQEMARRQALDAFNQTNNDWRRQRETRNTAWANRGAENRSRAYQQAYENRERAAAGMTGQYSTDVGARNAQRDRENERDQGLLAGIGEILDF